MKVLRTDNGKEYVNKNFHKFFEECGIQMQHFVPYTPQQNGVAECKNKALKEMETCMMLVMDLNLKIWDESIKYAVYVQNRAPHKALDSENT